ncbi:cytochrome P450 [Oscillatoria salina]|uniref:cytochrome P450 n=1 Tax=Oscillatoria salina TaxID=331517 RepID=UPI0013B90218|nr:cytochrome P450 [Oscillatoria salina]MBZ8180725.1 cytochrome P450 [Oscillatoria salina IIICB1]NET87592.1 cytochrome P450 [Kamptonema sp. SIO1D9]
MTTNKPEKLPLPPGKFGLPFLGETLSFLRDRSFAEKRHQQYGEIFKSSILGKPTIFLQGSEANQFIFSNENKNFVVSWPPSTQALLGSLSLALQSGETHKKSRKILYQAFQPRALTGYVSAMEQITQNYLEKWAQQQTLTWYPELRNYTLDIACKLLVGIDRGSQTKLARLFETWCQGIFTVALPLPWTKFGRAKQARKLLLAEIETIIRQRQQQSDRGNDTLGLLIEARDEDGNSLSIAELKDQVLLLLFTGHETLTSAIASFCFLVAQHPEVRAKIRSEQQKFSSAAPLTFDQLKQMTYLEQVLQEVLRLIPPASGGFRKVINPCQFQGYQIPQGWKILYQTYQTHLDASVYTQPKQFDPDRFNPEHSQSKTKTFSYIPFGGGIRECIGKEFARLEIKIFAALLARDYEWELLPNQNLRIVSGTTTHPHDGLQFHLKVL